MKPSEIAVETLGGDAAMATKEGLEPLMVAVGGLNVQLSPDTPASGLVQRLMAAPIAAAQGG